MGWRPALEEEVCGMCPLQDRPHLRRGQQVWLEGGGATSSLTSLPEPLGDVAWPVSWVGGVWRVRGRGPSHLSRAQTCVAFGDSRWRSCVWGGTQGVPGLRPERVLGNRDRVRSLQEAGAAHFSGYRSL